jgi:hypothetical protein
MAERVPQKAIFHEVEGAVYYVTNWQARFNRNQKAVIIRLSPRHGEVYRKLRAKGRSQKSVYYAIFHVGGRKQGPVKKSVTRRYAAPGASAPPSPASGASRTEMVEVPLELLNQDQLHFLVAHHLGHELPSLRRMPLDELRRL